MAQGIDTATPSSYELEILTLVNNEGDGFDLRGIFIECNIYESIHRNFLLGEVVLTDSTALLENAKLFGQESLRVKFKQPQGKQDREAHDDDTIDQVFRIYKIENITRMTGATQAYKINFCSPEMIASKRTRVSQAFSGGMTDIAALIARDYLDIASFQWEVREKSKGENYHVIIPNWTVGYAINWLCKQAQGVGSNSGLQDSYYWYQTAVGGYRIQSLNSMMKIKYGGGRPFRYKEAGVSDDKDVAYDETNEGVTGMGRRILSYQVGTHADVLKGVVEGLFASKQTTVDNTYKFYTEKSFNFLEKHFGADGMSLNEHPFVRTAPEELYSGSSAEDGEDVAVTKLSNNINKKSIGDYSEAYQILTSDSSFVNDETNTIHQANHETHLGSSQFRNAANQLLKYYTINVHLSARTDISVGTVINLDIPPVRPGEEHVEPKFHNGDHLITEIMWNLTPSKLKTNIKCMRDSVINNIETTKIEYGNSEKL